MILHVFQEKALFLKAAMDCFARAAIPSEYVVFTASSELSICGTPGDKVPVLKWKSEEALDFLRNIDTEKYTLILFHSLFSMNASVARKIIQCNPDHPPLAWVVYGSEIEHAMVFPGKYHGKSTRLTFYRQKPYRILIPVLGMIRLITGNPFKKLVKRMDYFVHFIPEELGFVEKELGIKKPSLWFTYIMLEDYIGKDLMQCSVQNSGKILVGNASGYNLNIIEALQMVARLNTNKEIMVPLAYGNKLYREAVIKTGQKLFGQAFRPLTQLLPLEEYNKLLLSCSSMIINSNKQQALGNIITAAWLGAKIFLNEQTSTYRYFSRKGLKIFSIEKYLNEAGMIDFNSLEKEDQEKNREILLSLFGMENVRRNIRESFMGFIRN